MLHAVAMLPGFSQFSYNQVTVLHEYIHHNPVTVLNKCIYHNEVTILHKCIHYRPGGMGGPKIILIV